MKRFKNILITGGTGFLGTNIYNFLTREYPQINVYLFSRRTGGNIKDIPQLLSATEGKDLVIHAAAQTFLAAALTGSNSEKNQFIATNYHGTLNVISACQTHHVPLIYVSTGEIYGSNINPGVPMTEDHPLNPQMGIYAQSKLDADLAVQQAIKAGLDARIIRPSGMFGFFQSQEKFFPKLIGLIKSGKPVTIHGTGQQVRDYTSAEDIAQAIWLLKDSPAGTIVNATAGKTFTLRQMADLIIDSCKRRQLNGKIVHTPDRPNQVQEFYLSSKKLHAITGWKAKKSLTTEIDRLVDYYLQVQISSPKILFFKETAKLPKPSAPNKTIRVEYASAVYGEAEVTAVNEVLRSRWLAPAKKTDKFQKKIARLFGQKHGLFVNSGSSALFLGVKSFNFPKGGEIITPACTFATTITSIIENKLTPVLVDSGIGTYNALLDDVEKAISPRTVAILVPHIIGNLNDMPYLSALAKKHGLKLIEDSCDTLGAKINGRPAGSWSDAVATSFYFVHHITAAGGGGMIMFNKDNLFEQAYSIRDWGRSATGYNENLNNRFASKLNGVPFDGKFISQNIGYNFKGVEVQAAFGLAQLKKLTYFNACRRRNMALLTRFFNKYSDFFITPHLLPHSHTVFLSYPLTIKAKAPFNRMQLVSFLEKHQIQTRPLFTGNVLRHPAYRLVPHRQVGYLKNADFIMKHTFVLPCHHALTANQLDYLFATYDKFLKKF